MNILLSNRTYLDEVCGRDRGEFWGETLRSESGLYEGLEGKRTSSSSYTEKVNNANR